MQRKLLEHTKAPELKGYKDICTGVQIIAENEYAIEDAMGLYHEIKERNNRRSDSSVERNIRHAKQYFKDKTIRKLPNIRFLYTVYLKYIKNEDEE